MENLHGFLGDEGPWRRSWHASVPPPPAVTWHLAPVRGGPMAYGCHLPFGFQTLWKMAHVAHKIDL